MFNLSQDELDKYERMSNQDFAPVLPLCVDALHSVRQQLAEGVNDSRQLVKKEKKLFRTKLGLVALGATVTSAQLELFDAALKTGGLTKFVVAASLFIAGFMTNDAIHDKKDFKEASQNLQMDYEQISSYYSVALARAEDMGLDVNPEPQTT